MPSSVALSNRESLCALHKAMFVIFFLIAVFGNIKPLYAAASSAANPQSDSSEYNYNTVTANYAVPDVTLTDDDGKPVKLMKLLAQPRPVLLQFVFASCSTICPILSATFSQTQTELDRVSHDYQMISISTDPEYDTSERLAAYAKRFHAGSHWRFLTGQKQDIHRVMSAFEALYQGDNKMYHQSLFYLRASPDSPWIRIEGFLNAAELVKKYRSVVDVAENTAY
jgi:protein SCO1